MYGKLQQFLSGMDNPVDANALGPVLRALADRMSSQTLSSAGLAIKTASSAVVKAGSAFQAIANGVLSKTAANTDMPALAGSVTSTKFNVFIFYIDAAATVTVAIGGEGATRGQVTWPNTPAGKAIVGYVLINPTGTGPFVGGTTALDDATVVPNAEYVNVTGAFDPSVLVGV